MDPAAPAGQRVVMFLYSDIRRDARVLREAGTLAVAGYAVTVMARPADPGSRESDRWRAPEGFDVAVIAVPGGWRRAWRVLGPPLRLLARGVDRLRPSARAVATLSWLVIWRFAVGGWQRAAAAAAPEADVYTGHDLTGLPAAVAAARRNDGRVIYDSHEIFLESGTYSRRPGWIRRRLARHERELVSSVAALVTVNDALVAELTSRYPVPRAIAVHNCPPLGESPSEPDPRLRRAIGAPDDAPIALYHGAFARERGLEQLAEAALEPGLETTHVAYLGFGSQRALLEGLAAEARFDGRLHVVDAVAPADVVAWVSGADVDVFALQPTTLNHILSTPNKLFEALAAGVPIVASDFPGIRGVVAADPSAPLGELCDPTDPAAIGRAMRRIVEADAGARAALRQRCLQAAHDRWNWEIEGRRLVELYADVAGSPA
jgi:glycosyltransferase involved in cell wall biosynthesis